MRLALSSLHNQFHHELEKKRNGKESLNSGKQLAQEDNPEGCSSISGMVWQFCNAAQTSSREQNDSVQRRQS